MTTAMELLTMGFHAALVRREIAPHPVAQQEHKHALHHVSGVVVFHQQKPAMVLMMIVIVNVMNLVAAGELPGVAQRVVELQVRDSVQHHAHGEVALHPLRPVMV